MKTSHYNLFPYLILGLVIGLSFFVLKPAIKHNYFYADILYFERNSWKYTIGISLSTFVVLIFFAFKKNKLNKHVILSNFILVSLLALFGKSLIDETLLYANLKIKTEKITKNYVVLKHDSNKVFHIYDNKSEFIFFGDELNKIDYLRIINGLNSLYFLQNKDTLNVNYKRGFLNVKFLK